MIVTLTMNPCVDLNLKVEAFEFDTPLRAIEERKRAGGKGVNVSQALGVLGVESIAVVPLGGPGGQEFAALAEDQFAPLAIKLVAAQIAGNTRTNTVTEDVSTARRLKVNQRGPILGGGDAAQVVAVLDEYVGYGDVVALCGSLPGGVHSGFYAELVMRYRSRGAFVALDADGDALQFGVKARPDVVKPNKEELQGWAGAGLSFEDAARRAATQTDGLCLATDGGRTALLATSTALYRMEPPKAGGSPVGAGDAALAGLLAGLTRAGDPAGAVADQETLLAAFRLAVACGTASASTADTEMFTAELLQAVLGQLGAAQVVG